MDQPDDQPDDRTGTWPDRDRRPDGRPENARPRDRFGAPLPRGAVDEMADRVEPEDVCTTAEEATARAIPLFDAQRFFEAHEFFEFAWKGPVTDDADRDLYKGLAQVAVGYTHTQRGNATGAASLLRRGIDHVRPYAPRHAGLPLQAVLDDASAFLEGLDGGRIEPTPDAPFPRWPED